MHWKFDWPNFWRSLIAVLVGNAIYYASWRHLATVINNLLITNNIDLQSDFHCRVLLTSPLESFTIGHTIVISRGLLDVPGLLWNRSADPLILIQADEASRIAPCHHIDFAVCDAGSFQQIKILLPTLGVDGVRGLAEVAREQAVLGADGADRLHIIGHLQGGGGR